MRGGVIANLCFKDLCRGDYSITSKLAIPKGERDKTDIWSFSYYPARDESGVYPAYPSGEFPVLRHSKKKLAALFELYTSDEQKFDKSSLRVRISEFSAALSRSQARRLLLLGVEGFRKLAPRLRREAPRNDARLWECKSRDRLHDPTCEEWASQNTVGLKVGRVPFVSGSTSGVKPFPKQELYEVNSANRGRHKEVYGDYGVHDLAVQGLTVPRKAFSAACHSDGVDDENGARHTA